MSIQLAAPSFALPVPVLPNKHQMMLEENTGSSAPNNVSNPGMSPEIYDFLLNSVVLQIYNNQTILYGNQQLLLNEMEALKLSMEQQ
jgi:hypothetical protein